MDPKTGNYILSSVVTALAMLFLAILLTTCPDKPDTQYWIKLGVVILGGLVGILSFPFMRKASNLAVFPESLLKPVLAGVLIVFFGILAFVAIRAAVNKQFGMTVLLVLILSGLGRAIGDFWKLKPKSRKPRNKRGSHASPADENGDLNSPGE